MQCEKVQKLSKVSGFLFYFEGHLLCCGFTHVGDFLFVQHNKTR